MNKKPTDPPKSLINPGCAICKGACCEGFRMPVDLFRNKDVQRWFNLHGQPVTEDRVYFQCPCTKLKEGLCSIYPDRPDICRKFLPGSAACGDAIRLRRPEQKEAIFAALIAWQEAESKLPEPAPAP